ncbi:MAG: deoxyribodipyrimidine photo-lyase/cryptochrome family protein [Myxococcota bacterium]
MQVVWFKRDLRVEDHRPLVEAAARGPVLCLYAYEPDIIEAPETRAMHIEFVNECLIELADTIRNLGGEFAFRVGRMPDVLEALHDIHPISALFSHRETGNAATYARDLRVADWVHARSIPWHEYDQFGVVRRLKSRDGWAARWNRRMTRTRLASPASLTAPSGVSTEQIRTASELDHHDTDAPSRQRGGLLEAERTLRSFLADRGAGYRYDMSSPNRAWEGCSRLSPHLAYGTVSLRTVYQETRARASEVKALRKSKAELDPRWLQSLSSFQSRLRWHCHFMQKLEDEPELEFHALNRALDGLRNPDFRQDYYDAWVSGQTGYPLVDACMRALDQAGWINFRMRAMLMSFASYHLWLPWRPTSQHLASRFLDFEPGIHFSQAQMQSGVTGINAVRIYSPIKQVHDHDPQGTFIRAYCPELAGVPDEHIAEPHKMTPEQQRRASCMIGQDYPVPIVEHSVAYASARRRIYAARRTPDARAESARVYEKHGSRRRPRKRRKGAQSTDR